MSPACGLKQPARSSLGGENSFGTGKQIKVIRQVIPHESEGNQLGGGEVCVCVCVCGVCVCMCVWGEARAALCFLFRLSPFLTDTLDSSVFVYKCSDRPPPVFQFNLPVR